MTDDALPTYAKALGRAGLLPFLALPLALYLQPQHSAFWGEVLAVYALAILCFLVGAWWGLALIRRRPSAMVLSNIVVIAVFFGKVLLATGGFLLLAALLFPLTVLVERSAALFRPQPPYYARLRAQLTAVATVSLLLSAVLL